MTGRSLLLLTVLLGLVVAACGSGMPDEPLVEETQVADVIELPDPREDSSISLESTLAQRRSVREFSDAPLEWEELGQLFWSAQGLTRDGSGRTNPSAGALYPLEVYVVTVEGLFHYLPDGHRAEHLSTTDLRIELSEAALGQEAVRDAPAVFVICGVFSRTEGKYGDRAERYVHLEVGHVGQSLLLQAVALDLGAVPIGAFSDGEVQDLLGLADDHEPLYLIPVGHPAR